MYCTPSIPPENRLFSGISNTTQNPVALLHILSKSMPRNNQKIFLDGKVGGIL
jgi:hypothetical protein